MSHNGSLDYARFIAAFGIVFFHAGAAGASLGYAALPFFLILMIVLAVPSAARLTFRNYASNRAQRLLVPWGIWSGIYATLKIVEVTLTQSSLGNEFQPHMILTGPALHLWFLPFAFVACMLIYPLARNIHRPSTFHVVIGMALVLTGAVILSLCQDRSFSVPFAQWINGLPAVCLGLALAITGTSWQRNLAISALFTGAALTLGATHGLEQLVIALAAYIISTKLRLPSNGLSKHLGALALGIYLSHPLVLSLLERTTALHKGDTTFALLGCLGASIIAWGQIKLGPPFNALRQKLRSPAPH